MSDLLLGVEALTTRFETSEGVLLAVDAANLEVHRGETVGLVGESGSGKSMLAYSILRLVPSPGRIVAGRISWKGRNLLELREEEMRRLRGREISFIFQEPSVALNPVLTVGEQVAEPLRIHQRLSRRESLVRAVELLRDVRIPAPERRVHDYPHQMSGGMKQRALIAMAIACSPDLVIADEPTTALDVTNQAQILDLLARLKEAYQLSLILISHDLGVVAENADRVAVMYAGRIVEKAPVERLFQVPQHPYTRGLLSSIPRARGIRGKEKLTSIEGTVPNLARLPPGCAFAPRCPDRFAPCDGRVPPLVEIRPGHSSACYLHSEVLRAAEAEAAHEGVAS